MRTRRWIELQDFRDLRRRADLKRYQVAELLYVTPRIICSPASLCRAKLGKAGRCAPRPADCAHWPLVLSQHTIH